MARRLFVDDVAGMDTESEQGSDVDDSVCLGMYDIETGEEATHRLC